MASYDELRDEFYPDPPKVFGCGRDWENEPILSRAETLRQDEAEDGRREQESESRIQRAMAYMPNVEDLPMEEALAIVADEFCLSESEKRTVAKRWPVADPVPRHGSDIAQLEAAEQEIEQAIKDTMAGKAVAVQELVGGITTQYGSQVLRAIRAQINELKRAA